MTTGKAPVAAASVGLGGGALIEHVITGMGDGLNLGRAVFD